MLVAAVFVPLSLSAGQDADLACDHGRQETPAAEDTCRVVFQFSPKKLMFQAPFRGDGNRPPDGNDPAAPGFDRGGPR